MSANDLNCRLCGEPAAFAFKATVLSKFEVSYFECASCGSLQTESPYWLEEAYDGHLGHLDLGVFQRNLTNQAACWLVARLWGLNDALDYGGGDGLLCRMLRDHGVNCHVWDKYGSPVYAQAFAQPNFATPELIFSFEVFEHFADPRAELAEIFDRGAKVVMASTGIYAGQDNTWFYLSLPSGRHVFFYSRKAIQGIGERFGYAALVSEPYILFVKPEAANATAAGLFRVMTKPIPLRVLRALMAIKRAPGVAADAALMKRIGERKPSKPGGASGPAVS